MRIPVLMLAFVLNVPDVFNSLRISTNEIHNDTQKISGHVKFGAHLEAYVLFDMEYH